MWTKYFKSAISLVIAGSVIAAMPVMSACAAVTANAASVVSAANANTQWYYNVISSSTIPDGEYIFYNAGTQTVMTDSLNEGNHSFPSYKTNAGLGYSFSASSFPSAYRYKIKSAGNGSYYIINSEGKYLNIVRYGYLEFTSTPSPLQFELYNDDDMTKVIVRKNVDGKDLAISMYSTDWFTVHDYAQAASGQLLTLMKYESTPTSVSFKKLSDYGIQNYDTQREFTPQRNGDMSNYTRQILKMTRGMSNRMSTGIWATPGEKLKIYVQAESNDPIPQIVFTQHISNSYEYKEIQLQKGINEITVPQLHADISDYETKTELGGTVYLCNPYTQQKQSKNVKVYIEGGDKIPVFRKGDNVKKFITELKDYYAHFVKGEKGYHNITELTSDHTLFTLMLDRVYEGYVTNGLDPQSAAETWDEYMEGLFAFNGLTPEQYKNFVLPVKVNQPYGGAYAALGFLGIQNGDMSAFALTDTRRGWGYSHETGHILDVNPREYTEVTNNMWSMEYALTYETWYDIAIHKRNSERTPLAVNEENSLWQTNPTNFWTLSMFWDLEVYHNGYWKELDTMFRNGSSGNAAVDKYAANMSQNEKVAAYSSKIIGIDLTYYFKRYGFITEPSSYYKNAITSMSLSKSRPKIWYYDDEAYNKPLDSNLGKEGTLTCSADKASNSTFFTLSSEYKDAHLGFEIVKNGKVVDFVWDYKYTAADIYSSDYTINAYDRSLNLYKSVDYTVTLYPQQYVAICGTSYYSSLKQAVDAAPNGGIVYVAESTAINEQITVDGKDVTIMPLDPKKKVVVYNNVSADVFVMKNGGTLTIKSGSQNDDTFVFDGQDKKSYTLFRLYSGASVELDKGVTVRHFNNAGGGSVAYAEEGAVILKGCILEYNSCKTGTIYLSDNSILSSSAHTVFRQNKADAAGSAIYIETADSSAYLKDTIIYKNFSGNQNTGSTIYAKSGYLSVGSGTSIAGNFSDWYNLNSAMYLSNTARAEFSGNLNISDSITTAGKIYIDPKVSGVLNVRTPYDFTKTGNTVAVPLTGSFSKNILATVQYHHNICHLVNKTDSLVIAESSPLVNTSSVSATSVSLGNTVTVKASATGGTGSYTYAVYYKKSTDSKWTTKQDFKETGTISVKPANAATYSICVKVRDADGTIEKKYFTVTVKQSPLTLNASVSANSIYLGNTVTVKASASGGAGSYTYAFYYKKTSDTKWTTKQDFKANASASIKPAKATTYDVCAKVKDKSGNVVKKYFTVKVSTPLSITAKIPVTAKLGNTIPVTISATGGTAPYTYAVYYKKTTDTKWVTKQDFKTTNSVSVKPAKAAEYEICVKVKDSTGTVAKKYFYVTVT